VRNNKRESVPRGRAGAGPPRPFESAPRAFECVPLALDRSVTGARYAASQVPEVGESYEQMPRRSHSSRRRLLAGLSGP
jgi:hypothetical protein